jgi:carboxypeptidase Q
MDKFGSISSLSLWFLICIQILSRPNISFSQEIDTDAFFIKSIHDKALTDQMSYQWLYYLSEKIGGRLAGSPQSLAAVEFTKQILDTLGCNKVYTLPTKVNYWFRGAKEQVKLINHQNMAMWI